MAKEDIQIRRVESLGITISTEDGSEKTLDFRSLDEENLYVYIISENEEQNEFVGSLDLTNFLAFCERALQLWKEAGSK